MCNKIVWQNEIEIDTQNFDVECFCTTDVCNFSNLGSCGLLTGSFAISS